MFIKSERSQQDEIIWKPFKVENKATASFSADRKTFTRKKIYDQTDPEKFQKKKTFFYLCSCDLIGHNFDLFNFMFDTDVVFLSSERLDFKFFSKVSPAWFS